MVFFPHITPIFGNLHPNAMGHLLDVRCDIKLYIQITAVPFGISELSRVMLLVGCNLN